MAKQNKKIKAIHAYHRSFILWRKTFFVICYNNARIKQIDSSHLSDPKSKTEPKYILKDFFILTSWNNLKKKPKRQIGIQMYTNYKMNSTEKQEISVVPHHHCLLIYNGMYWYIIGATTTWKCLVLPSIANHENHLHFGTKKKKYELASIFAFYINKK